MHNEPAAFEQEIQTHIGALADDPVGALSALTALSKKQAARVRIDRLLADRSPVYAALTGAEPKSRKNAARLLGASRRPATRGLCRRRLLRAETTRFVVPSIPAGASAIFGSDTAKAALEAYAVPRLRTIRKQSMWRKFARQRKRRSPRWNANCRCPSK
jgi:hypothetical protein